jgi:hypothetical protein
VSEIFYTNQQLLKCKDLEKGKIYYIFKKCSCFGKYSDLKMKNETKNKYSLRPLKYF